MNSIGAYYFDGWAGRHKLSGDPNESWALNAPTHLTRRMLEEFPEREPVWGWRDDSLAIMERQIDLAADHGLAFFAFDWYWHDNGQALNAKAILEDPLNTGLKLFLKARNNRRLKFCLLVANHTGFEIKGTQAWKQAADHWMPLFTNPGYLTAGGKPLVVIFNCSGGDKEGLACLETAAQKAGLPGVAITGTFSPPRRAGYPLLTHYNYLPCWETGLEEHPYKELVAFLEGKWIGTPEQPYMPCVIAGWDRRPWEEPAREGQKFCWYFPDRTPEAFETHLKNALTWMDRNPDKTPAERIAFIYAWNELGEGGYIVPTKGDPKGEYLMALKSVLMPQSFH